MAASYERQWQVHELLRGKNLSTLERIKDKQICIASDEMSGLTVYRDLKKLIVLGITACLDLYTHVNPLRLTGQSRYETSSVFFVNIPAKLLSVDNIIEFRKRCK